MRIWILKDSEPLPLRPDVKMLRASMLSNALIAHGHEVHYWCSTFSHFHKKKESPEEHSVMQLPNGTCYLHRLDAGTYARNISLARLRHHRTLVRKWIDEAEKHPKPDVIFVAYPIIEWAEAAIAFGSRHNIPVIVDVRDQWPDTFANYMPAFAKPFISIATRLCYRNLSTLFAKATVITSMSTPVLEWALTKGRRAKDKNTAVFYLGTSLAAAFKEPPAPLLRPSNPLRCIFLGTLGNTSDIMTIAKAARLLHESCCAAHITVVGDGDYKEAFYHATKDLPNVTIVGWCNTPQIIQLLAESDAALLTGHNEAMPNKFFDYLAAGLPILCSLRGEVRDYVNRHKLGVCFNSGNPEEIVQAIASLSKDYAAFASNVRTVPEHDYSEQEIYNNLSHYIAGIVTQHNAHG